MTHALHLTKDGDTWLAWIGPNLQDGIVGYGDTPADALRSLAAAVEREGWGGEELRVREAVVGPAL